MASDDETEYKPVKLANGRTVMSRKTRQQKQKSKEKNEQGSDGSGNSEAAEDEGPGEDSKSTANQSQKTSSQKDGNEEEDDNASRKSACNAASQKAGSEAGSQKSSRMDDPKTARQKVKNEAPLVFLGGPPSSAGGKPRSERNRYIDSIAQQARRAGYYPDVRYSSGGPVMALGPNRDDIASDTKLAYAKYLGRKARGDGYVPHVFRSSKDLDDEGQSQYTITVTTLGDDDELEERLIQQEQNLQDHEAKLMKCHRAADKAKQQAQDLAEELQRLQSATAGERERRDSLLAKHMEQSREAVARRAAEIARQRRNKMQDLQDGEGQYGGGSSASKRAGGGSDGGSRSGGGSNWERKSSGGSGSGGGSGSRYSRGSQSQYAQSQY